MKQLNTILISLALLVIASAFVFELTGKGWLTSTLPGDNELKTIEFWQYWSGKEKEPLEDLVAKFNKEEAKKLGFKVKMLSISMPRKKILMAMAGSVTPDLMHLDSDMVVDFALRGGLEELNEIAASPSALGNNGFIEIFLEMLNLNGKQFAMPWMPNIEAMHLNKTLLDELGLKEPETLEEIALLNKRLAASPSNGGIIAWHPSWPPWVGKFIPVVFGASWAEKQKDGSYKITANSKENIQAWTWVEKNFVKTNGQKKLQSFVEGFSSYQSPDNPFYRGKILLENNGVWEKNLASIFAPQIEISISAFPGRVKDASYVTADCLAIPKSAKNKQEAKLFMQWLLKQENLEYLALAQGKFIPLKNHSEEFFTKHRNQYIKTFIELASSPNTKYFPQLSFSNRYKREIKNAYEKVIKAQLSAKEALDELQSSMEAISN